MNEDIPLRRIHHVRFFVGNARQSAYFYRNAFGFEIAAYKGLETGSIDEAGYILKQGNITLVLESPLRATHPESDRLRLHGDGVRDIALEVDDVELSYRLAVERGATGATVPMTLTDEFGSVTFASIRAYGDTTHSFVNHDNYTGPFAPGNTVVQFAYSMPLGSEEITVAQKMPAQMPQVAVVAQKIGNMRLTSPQLTGQREMSADGQAFVVAQGGALRAGDTLTLTLSGLPHRPAWPTYIALTLAGTILAAGAWSASRGRTAPDDDARRRQLHADRDELFSELASLEAQRRKGAIEAPAYASRREQIVTALEDLYAGIEHEVA